MKLNKKMQKPLVLLLCMALMAGLLCGCANILPFPAMQAQNASQAVKTEEGEATLGETPNLDYAIPSVTTNIRIAEYGYLPHAEKYAVFLGTDLGIDFRLIKSEDGSAVYRGELKELGIFASNGEPVYLADFSDYQQEGTFYLEHDKIGRSYPFEIREGGYEEFFRAAQKEMYLSRCGVSLPMEYAGSKARNACHTTLANSKSTPELQLDVSGGWHTSADGSRDVQMACEDLALLLLAYRYCTPAFDDETGEPESGNGIPDLLDEIRYETDWLLKMQEPKTGAVYAGVSVMTRAGADNLLILEDISVDASLCFAAAMARFSYLYQEYDSVYATSCIQAADRALKSVRGMNSEMSPAYFWAAAEMYRATGYYNYKQIVDAYLAEHTVYDLENMQLLHGYVAYLDTAQKTDVNICTLLINAFRQDAEKISLSASSNLYGSLGTSEQELFRQTLILLIVNYVISSNEYETILERYAQYFLGCNTAGTCYVTGPEQGEDETEADSTIWGGLTSGFSGGDKKTVEWTFEPQEYHAEWTVLLSGIVSYSKEMEE